MKYQSREFCKDTNCPLQHLLDNAEDKMDTEFAREYCRNDCSAYDFHQWLDENRYDIVKDFDYSIAHIKAWFDELKAVTDILHISRAQRAMRKIEEYLQDLEGDDGKTLRELRNNE